MKEKWIRGAFAGLAVLLLLVYVFLPVDEILQSENNSGRKKQEITAGEEYAWTWSPREDGFSSVAVRWTGASKAPELTLNLSLTEGEGTEVASVSRNASDLEESSGTMALSWPLKKGTLYTLRVLAEGEGAVKLRGDIAESSGEFEPMMSLSGTGEVRNPVLLYFALGAVLVALTPVRGDSRKAAKIAEKESPVSRILPWLAFAMIASLGIYITVRRPMFDILGDWRSWDEDTHWEIVQQMGLFRVEGVRRIACDLITWAPGYAPLAVGYSLGQIFTSEAEVLYRAAIACSSLCYAGMCALAVKLAPRYKTSFLVAGTLPTIIFLMTSMSYDTVVIGSILLGLAYLLRILDRKERVTSVQAITMVSLLAFGTVAKPAYSIVLLALLMIPAEQLGGKGNARLFRLFVLFMTGWCFAAMAMPGAYEDVLEGDWRFEGTSVSGQIAYMLAHPVEGGLRPLRYVWDFRDSLMTYGISHWGYLGNNGQANEYYLWLMCVAAPLCTVGETWNRRSVLSAGRRIGLAAVAFGAETMIAYGQFLASTPVGGSLQGMQFRYFIPVWIPTLLAIMWPHAIRSRLGKVSEWASLAVWAACLIINVQNMMGYMIGYSG